MNQEKKKDQNYNERIDNLISILEKICTLDQKILVPKETVISTKVSENIAFHLVGCHGYVFQLEYATKEKILTQKDEIFFNARHSEHIGYCNYEGNRVPCKLNNINSVFHFSITRLGEEESIHRIHDIIKWIMLNKEEAFVYSWHPSAFIQDKSEGWRIPRFKLDCNPDLLNPTNLELYNFLIHHTILGSAIELNKVRKELICNKLYESYTHTKSTINNLYSAALNVWRKEYPMDILTFLPIFKAITIRKDGRLILYIDSKYLKNDTKSFPYLNLDYKKFLQFYIDKDKISADDITEKLDYIWQRNYSKYDNIFKSIFKEDTFNAFHKFSSFNVPEYFNTSIRPFEHLPGRIDFDEEKNNSYWLTINDKDLAISVYSKLDMDLDLNNHIHQFNSGDYRIADLMYWLNKNYFNQKGEDVK